MFIEHLIQTDAQFLQNFDETLLFQLDRGIYYYWLNEESFIYLEEILDTDKFPRPIINELYDFLDYNGFLLSHTNTYTGIVKRLYLKGSRRAILQKLIDKKPITLGKFLFSDWYLDKVWENENNK